MNSCKSENFMDFMKNVFWIAFQIKMTANYRIVLKIIYFNGIPHSRVIFQIEFLFVPFPRIQFFQKESPI